MLALLHLLSFDFLSFLFLFSSSSLPTPCHFPGRFRCAGYLPNPAGLFSFTENGTDNNDVADLFRYYTDFENNKIQKYFFMSAVEQLYYTKQLISATSIVAKT